MTINDVHKTELEALEKLRGTLGSSECAKMVEAGPAVRARFQPVFDPRNLSTLTKENFLPFLNFSNNQHWSGLHRKGPEICSNMARLRAALAVLLDESRSIDQKIDELRPGGRVAVSGMGRAILTAILVVMYPDQYGVWNNTSENAIKVLGLWPKIKRGESFGRRYTKINDVLLGLAGKLGTDLWTLDTLLWKALDEKPADNKKGTADDWQDPLYHPLQKDANTTTSNIIDVLINVAFRVKFDPTEQFWKDGNINASNNQPEYNINAVGAVDSSNRFNMRWMKLTSGNGRIVFSGIPKHFGSPSGSLLPGGFRAVLETNCSLPNDSRKKFNITQSIEKVLLLIEPRAAIGSFELSTVSGTEVDLSDVGPGGDDLYLYVTRRVARCDPITIGDDQLPNADVLILSSHRRWEEQLAGILSNSKTEVSPDEPGLTNNPTKGARAMTLKDVLQQFLNENEWEDKIEHNDDDDADFINTGYQIEGQNYRLILSANEPRQVLNVLLFSPIKVPKARAKEATFLLNFLNVMLSCGNCELAEDGSVYFRWAIDVDGATAAPKQFGTLVGAAAAAFNEATSSSIGAVAFTKQSGEDIIEEFRRVTEKSG